MKSRNKTVPSGEGVEDNSTEWGRRRAGGLRGGSRKLRYVGQISTPSLLTNALGRPAIWAGPRGYSNIQSEEETEAATAAGGAATKRGGSGGANKPLPHPALVPWEDAGWGRVARECARACACVRACLPPNPELRTFRLLLDKRELVGVTSPTKTRACVREASGRGGREGWRGCGRQSLGVASTDWRR